MHTYIHTHIHTHTHTHTFKDTHKTGSHTQIGTHTDTHTDTHTIETATNISELFICEAAIIKNKHTQSLKEFQNLIEKAVSLSIEKGDILERLQALEDMCEQLASKELFDDADKQHLNILNLRSTLRVCVSSLSENTDIIQQVCASMQQIADHRLQLLESLMPRIDSIRNTIERESRIHIDSTKSRLKVLYDLLQLEQDRVSRILSNFKLQMDIYNNEYLQVTGALDAQTEEIRRERSEAVAELSETEEQISELERQLALLYEKKNKLKGVISGADASIEVHRCEFSSDFSRLESMSTSLSVVESDLKMEQAHLDRMKVSYSEEDSHSHEIVCYYERERYVCDDLDSVITHTISVTKQEVSNRLKWINNDFIFIQRKMDTETRLCECVSRVNEIEDLIRIDEEECVCIRDRVCGLEQRLSSLQIEKRKSIANRSFKDAARITAQIKTITERLTTSEDDLTNLTNTLNNNRQNLISLQSEEKEVRVCVCVCVKEVHFSFIKSVKEKGDEIAKICVEILIYIDTHTHTHTHTHTDTHTCTNIDVLNDIVSILKEEVYILFYCSKILLKLYQHDDHQQSDIPHHQFDFSLWAIDLEDRVKELVETRKHEKKENQQNAILNNNTDDTHTHTHTHTHK
eukprot:GHVR01057913.1.p1 GENE.GHVR01057913.1~~GHVR01057913.1.p1  ORF type:complete len:633 (+),score=277.64 GHVR01057913.1:679-2577(+)